VENLSGNARSAFRREFDELNNLQAVIGCKRHMVSLSWEHVMGLSEMTALPKRLFSSPGVLQHSSSFSHSLPTHTPPHINSYHTCSTHSPLQSTSPDSSIFTMGFEKGTFSYAANVIRSGQIDTFPDSIYKLVTSKVAVKRMRNHSLIIL
jgi:hypothetical protein